MGSAPSSAPTSGPPLILRPSPVALAVEVLVAVVGVSLIAVAVLADDVVSGVLGVAACAFAVGGLRSQVRADDEGVEVVGRLRRRRVGWHRVEAVKVGTETDLSPLGRQRVIVCVCRDGERVVLAPTRRFDFGAADRRERTIGPFDAALDGLRRRLARAHTGGCDGGDSGGRDAGGSP